MMTQVTPFGRLDIPERSVRESLHSPEHFFSRSAEELSQLHLEEVVVMGLNTSHPLTNLFRIGGMLLTLTVFTTEMLQLMLRRSSMRVFLQQGLPMIRQRICSSFLTS